MVQPGKKEIKVSIVREKDQFAIRIPSKIAETLDINPKKDSFLFIFDEKDLHLTGELIEK